MSPVAKLHRAEVQIKALQHLFGAARHALVFVARLLGRGDRNELDLGELMLADHAARIAAGRTRLGAEARRLGGDAQRQLPFLPAWIRAPDW